jgi:hypothetical protein
MGKLRFDLSAQSWERVFFLTICGTLFCIGVAFSVDSYSFQDNSWRLGLSPVNDLLIPLLPGAAVLLLPALQTAGAG